MSEQLNSDDERAVRRIANDDCWDHVQPSEVKTTDDGRIMLVIDPEEARRGMGNAFAGHNLEPFVKEGYIPCSVTTTHAWFQPIGVGLDL